MRSSLPISTERTHKRQVRFYFAGTNPPDYGPRAEQTSSYLFPFLPPSRVLCRRVGSKALTRAASLPDTSSIDPVIGKIKTPHSSFVPHYVFPSSGSRPQNFGWYFPQIEKEMLNRNILGPRMHRPPLPRLTAEHQRRNEDLDPPGPIEVYETSTVRERRSGP